VGTGALIVVDGAAQFGTMVADAGPDWMGLQPGSASRSGSVLARVMYKECFIY